jgi:signal transduction histidine kinase
MLPYEFSVFALLMGAVTLLAVFLTVYPLVFRPKSRHTFYFIAMISSTIFWCLGYTLEIAANEESVILFWNYVQYIGIVTIAPCFLLFVLVFTNRSELSSKPLLSLIFFPPLIHYLLLLSNNTHNLFYISIGFETTPFMTLDLVYGPAFYTNVIYSYSLTAFAIVLLVRDYLSASKENILYQKQLLIMVIGALFIIFGNLIRIFNLIPPLEFLDLTPVSFVICYILFTYALFEMGFLDIVPIARHAVFEEILDGLIVLDNNLRLVDINTAAKEALLPEFDFSKMYGNQIFSVLRSIIRRQSHLEKLDEIEQGLKDIRDGKISYFSTDFELFYPTRALHRKEYNFMATPLEKDNKALLGYVIILRDISDRQEAERSLQQKNQMQELFLKLLSHDLRNHLNVLKGYSELAVESKSEDQTIESLQAISIKSDATLKLIDEVTAYLQVSDMLRSQLMEKYNLIDVIQNAIEQLKPEFESKRVSLRLNLPTTPAHILANVAINSLVLNLLQNAIKFSPIEKEVSISIELIMNQNWQVNIADLGPGIPDELKEKVFEPFASFGTQKGTGLGLTIVREAIRYFQGNIWIEDNQPNGAIFKFIIPRVEDN